MIEVIAYPTLNDFHRAFTDLNHAIQEFWPEEFLNELYFCRWCEGAHERGIQYLPALFMEDGRCVAMLSFNHYSIANKTVEVDFLAIQPRHSMALVRCMKRCLEYALDNPEIDLMLGIFRDNPKVRRWSKHFGFQPFAQVGERIYTHRTQEKENG
jgi:hypothetical protein